MERRGVDGDAHAGTTVQHLSRVRADPTQPNLRQVHLIHEELFDDLAAAGFDVGPGNLGENVTTRGVGLLDLSAATRLHLGRTAVVQVTGLRNPCQQLNRFADGLMQRLLVRGRDGTVIRKAGIMRVVERGGVVRPGDRICVEPPVGEHVPLEVV